MKVGVRESYIGPMFADDANRIKLKGYVSTDIYAQKEFFKKRVFLSSTVSNLFNTSYKSNPSVTWGGWTRVGSPPKSCEADHWREGTAGSAKHSLFRDIHRSVRFQMYRCKLSPESPPWSFRRGSTCK